MSIENEDKNYSRWIEFNIGEQLYAIPLLKVREVIPIPKTTPIPKAPSYFEGVMNLRGQIIAIIDMRKKFQIISKALKSEPAAIIIDLSGVKIGILVDSINTVFHVNEDDLENMSAGKINNAHPYILNIYNKSEEELVIIIDIEKALDITDLKVLQNEAAA